MAESSAPADADARNDPQSALRVVASALAATPLDVLAAAIGKDESTACRIRSEEAKVSISDAVRLIYAAGKKVVSAEKVCVDREMYEAMVSVTSRAMSDAQTVRRLTWDE